MKCSACGNENVLNARFCAFCGAKLAEEPEVIAKEPEQAAPARHTARPLSDNPYMPPRPPVIPSAKPAKHAAADADPKIELTEEKTKAVNGPRQIIKPSEKRVFLFDEEEEEAARYQALEDEDEFTPYEDEEEDDELYEDEEDEPRGGRIFVRIISVLTVIILIIGVISFMYGTTIGRRLRASVGMSSEAEDYLLLADWQLAQHSLTDASASYYTAFKLDQSNYELALTVGTGFEKSGDDTRASQLYTYLIEAFPQADEPYDRLMALLMRQGKTDQYDALILYRAEHQAGYTPPTVPAPDAPTASHQGGAYAGSVTLTLDAAGLDIRYTLDGTAPTATSLLYTGPITLTRGTHNLRAVAVRDGQISAEWTGSFIVS